MYKTLYHKSTIVWYIIIMKLIKWVLILAFILIPTICNAQSSEYYVQELLDNPQQGEINLQLNSSEDEIQKTVITDEIPEKYEDYDKYYEDDEYYDIADPVEKVFQLFDTIGKKNKETDTTEDIFSKVFKSKIVRTDVPSFLLKNELTFDYEDGLISQAHFYGGYRGSINALFSQHHYKTDYNTDYDTLTAEAGVYGRFRNPNYAFKFKIRPVPTSGIEYFDKLIGDAYIVNNRIPHHKIILGYSRVQTGIEGGSSSFILPFVVRSQIARNFGNARSVSAKLIGNYNYADYSFAFGSSGRYITSGMPGTEFTGWVNFKPFGSSVKKTSKFGKLTIGGGLNTGHNGTNYTVGSAYIGYKYKKLWTNFEAAIADGYNNIKSVSTDRASGFAYTLGWKLNPHFQIIGRFDQFDPNRKISHNSKREYSIGLNWFIKGQALKFVFNYVFCQNQGAKDSHRLIFATQIML